MNARRGRGLVFRGGANLVGGHQQGDGAIDRVEPQPAPGHRDAALAQAHEAADVDHRGAGLPVLVDQHIHHAPGDFASLVQHLAPEDRRRDAGVYGFLHDRGHRRVLSRCWSGHYQRHRSGHEP